MNTEHDWLVWWHDEGSGMRPVNGQDHEEHVRDMTRIAWLNGAFGAADEIERLRKKLLGEENAYDILRLENERIRAELVTVSNKLTDERDEARHGEAVATATLYGMIEERISLRAERDEARREVCVLMQRTGFLRGDYAAERGWDCYKKEPNDIEAHEVRGDVAGPEGAD